MGGLIPRSFIDELLNRINIVDIIERRVPLKKRGSSHLGLCPFHNEKTPSFNVSAAKQFFHCFGCGVSGNVISFIMEHERLDFVSAIETLASDLNLPVPREGGTQAKRDDTSPLYSLLQQASHYYQQQLRQHPQRETVIDYLKQRGLSGDIVKHFQIGYAPSGWDNVAKQLGKQADDRQALITSGLLITKDKGGCYDRFRDRIMFPIRDRRGRVIAFGGRVLNDDLPKYLNSPETPVFHKSKELYGLYEALQSNRRLEQVIVVEGYMDVVALAQHGISYAVATLGTSTSADHIRQLLRFTKTISFCFDGDKAGKKAAWRALETSLSLIQDGLELRFMFLPEGEDPDSFVRQHGAEAFERQIKQSPLLSEMLLTHLAEQVDVQSVDGKSRYLQLASPWLKQIPECAFRYLLLEQMGRQLQMTAERVEQLTLGHTEPSPHIQSSTSQPSRHQQKRQPRSTLRLIIALLLQNPQLAACIDEAAIDSLEPSPGYDLLQRMMKLLKSNTHLTTGHLLEYWRNDKLHNRLVELASWQHYVPQDGIQDEFIGAWHRLQQQQQQARIKDMMSKAQHSGLTHEEKLQLQALIQSKRSQDSK